MKKIKLYSCLLLISIFSLMPLKVFAVNVDYGFYNANDIIYYDPNACSSNSSSSSSGGGAAETAEQNLEAILKYFTAKGLSLAAAAGIAGNLVMESGLNPAKIEGGAIASDDFTPVNGQGFGLAQWTFTDRQQPLIDLAKTQGKKITDMTLQLDYIWLESTTGKIEMLERLNGIKSETSIGSASAPMAAAIIFHGRTPNTIGSSVQEIIDVDPPYGFEGSGDSASKIVENRGKSAEEYYGRYKGKIADGTGVVGIGSSTVGASSSGSSNCSSSSGGVNDPPSGNKKPDNVDDAGSGWTLKDNTDYSNVKCAPGTTDAGTYKHTTHGFTIRLCTMDGNESFDKFSSLISLKLLDMVKAAAKDGITLAGTGIDTGFRSYERQDYYYQLYLSGSGNKAAPPGDSQHERGLAIDFDDGQAGFFNWMTKNAATYGFYNYEPETWHWSMSGW